VKGELVDPLLNAAGHLKPLWKRPADITPVPVAERKQA
jgi:hypothetical protein